MIEDAIARRVFPGATLAIALRGAVVALRAFGHFTYRPAQADAVPGASELPHEVTTETCWDLASLTKPLATTSMAMLLYERGKLRLEERVVAVLPEFAALQCGDEQRAWRDAVTVRALLAHSSGLPAHRKLYLEAKGREAIVAAAMRVPLEHPPLAHAEYSDLGFILLGELLERVAGERLDSFCAREMFKPLNLNLTFCPQPTNIGGIPPTTNADYRGRIVQGEVNDENAAAMDGVAGHAGLFGDVLSVLRFAQCMLGGGEPMFQPATVALFTARDSHPDGTSRTLGWDTPSKPSQSGTLFSARSFGHLGYTGTSLWGDPERQLAVTLLTNRTWPDGQNQAIKQVRPVVHDAIVRAVQNELR